MSKNKTAIRNIFVLLVFTTYLIVGLIVYKDYGINYDGPGLRKLGTETYNYVLKGNKKLLKNDDKYYGSLFEFSLVATEKAFGMTSLKQIYEMRHLATFLVSLVGTAFFYFLVKKLFRDWRYGLLGSIFLMLSPRIFAHSFYNTKDLVFMSICIPAVYFAIRFMEKPTKANSFYTSVFAALATAVRIMGILIPTLTLFLYVVKMILSKKKPNLSLIFIFIFTFVAGTFALWPYLWENPVGNFREAFEEMSSYPQKTSTLYFGKKVSSLEVPWHYIPDWIAVTTPFMYVLLFCIGIVQIIFNFLKKYKDLDYLSKTLLVMGWVFIPLTAVIVLDSVLYNAWRQMLFIYPAFLIIAIYGLAGIVLYKSKILVVTAITAVCINLATTGGSMIKWHPFQNVYFNNLAGKRTEIENKFELDYWGLSYKQALEYLDKTVDKENITITTHNAPGIHNAYMLDNIDRFTITESKNPTTVDFHMTNLVKRDLDNFEKLPEYYSIQVDGYKIMRIYSTSTL